MQAELEALKGRLVDLTDMQSLMRRDNDFKRQQQKEKEKVADQSYSDQVSEKLRDFEGRIALFEAKL